MTLIAIPDGQATGLLERQYEKGEIFPMFRERVPAIPRKDWDDLIDKVDLTPLVWVKKNQGGEGSCAGNSSTSTVETVRKFEGQDDVELSAMSLYKRTGRSAGSGSSLDSNLKELSERGVLPVDGTPGYEHTHPRTGFGKRLPVGWEDTAALFRLTEWWDLDRFEDFVTAIVKGFSVSFGVRWGRGGHAIMAVKIVKEGRKYGCKFLNSWGVGWGDEGFGVMWEDQIGNGLSSFGGWCARVAVAA